MDPQSSSAPLKASRSQQRTRSEILMRAIANENVFLVKKLLDEGVSLPSKYDGMDVEMYVFNHFSPEVADILKSVARKWDYSKLGALLQSPPAAVVNHAETWAQFICDTAASSSLQQVYSGILVRWKNTNLPLTTVLCDQLSVQENARDWSNHIVKTQSSRHAALVSLVHLQSTKAWNVFKAHWVASDFVKLCDEISRGIPISIPQINFLKTGVQDKDVEGEWATAHKALERNHKKFESFYKKTFGSFSTTSEFITSHTALRWKGLNDSISDSFTVLGLPWWRGVQAQGRAVAKSTLGNDVPSQIPRSFDHALLINPYFTVTDNASPRLAQELRTPFDAFSLARHPPLSVKKIIVNLPSLRGWRDEHNNNLGHYIAAFTALNKSLWTTLAKRCPQWFEENNLAGNSIATILSTTHPYSSDVINAISQELLKKVTKKATKRTSSSVRKI